MYAYFGDNHLLRSIGKCCVSQSVDEVLRRGADERIQLDSKSAAVQRIDTTPTDHISNS